LDFLRSGKAKLIETGTLRLKSELNVILMGKIIDFFSLTQIIFIFIFILDKDCFGVNQAIFMRQ